MNSGSKPKQYGDAKAIAKKPTKFPKLKVNPPTIQYSWLLDSFHVYSNAEIPLIRAVDITTDQAVSFDPYKLHIRVSAKEFISVFREINELLYLAINSRIIKDFKVLDPEVASKMKDGRTVNCPYTIYLFHEYDKENAKKVAELCLQIEKILKNAKIAVANKKYITPSELELSEYFLYRMTTLNPKERMYVRATNEYADLLEQVGRESEYFQTIFKLMQPVKKPVAAVSAGASKYVLLPGLNDHKQHVVKKVAVKAIVLAR